ncbi:hypothetical protein [Paenibacillus arenilitoris]|uniref:Uncharacterized protein n=1 Tax=Paenibacillus arenilitoris TaxID=2772299 RepID=A0A927CLF1_9BACL|nr:hypothetical protein [Paenibacillus arenilitoris]MBD2868957.1 hypothetical protein [Paenibacillus arenilitoris]
MDDLRKNLDDLPSIFNISTGDVFILEPNVYHSYTCSGTNMPPNPTAIITTTMNIYGHALRTADQVAVDKFESLLTTKAAQAQ